MIKNRSADSVAGFDGREDGVEFCGDKRETINRLRRKVSRAVAWVAAKVCGERTTVDAKLRQRIDLR